MMQGPPKVSARVHVPLRARRGQTRCERAPQMEFAAGCADREKRRVHDVEMQGRLVRARSPGSGALAPAVGADRGHGTGASQ
jgi:hypothetical protein